MPVPYFFIVARRRFMECTAFKGVRKGIDDSLWNPQGAAWEDYNVQEKYSPNTH